MNTFEKVVHKAIHKQALNSAVHDLSEDDLIILKRNPNLIDAEVLEKIRVEIEALNEKVGVDYKICVDKSDVLQIIDKYRNEVSS